MQILHLSDIHYRITYEDKKDGYHQMLRAMTDPLRKLDFCLDRAFAAHPDIDLVLISGDLCEDGEAEDYRALREHLKNRLGSLPLLVTPGNHDRKEAFRIGWLTDEEDDGERISKPYNALTELDGITVISFDSAIYGVSDGYLSGMQLDWLRDQLERIGRRPCLLLTHHHLLDAHESIPALPEAEELKPLLLESNVAGILCGHTHHCFAGSFMQIPYYTADALSFYGTDQPDGSVLFEEKYGYNYYRLEDGRIVQSSLETFSDQRMLACVKMQESC